MVFMGSKYEVTTETLSGLEKIVIPRFQRGYVWGKKKKEDLIVTLHKGFPFGSLLTYKGSSGDEQLLDGQQRLSTIRDYINNAASYWKNLNKEDYDKELKKMNSKLIKGDLVKDEDFSKLISKKVDLADWVDEFMKNNVIEEGVEAKFFRDIVINIQKKINEYLDINKIKIPIIRFTGDKENIAEVFENLNKGGVQLTKFEIFAAAWNHHRFELRKTKFQNEILDEVKKYYLEKANNAEELGFDLEGFSEDDLTENREINLFEFGMALGRFAGKRANSLLPSDSEKSKNELGFGILAIFTGIDPKKMNEINNLEDYIYENIESILEKTDEISEKLDSIFSKLLKQYTSHTDSKPQYQRYLNTAAKTLSYYASLWDSNNSKNIYNNLPVYYLRDALANVWTSHGDQRLFDFYPDRQIRSYDESIPKKELEDTFSIWLKDKNFGRINFNGEVKALETIRANLTYLSHELPNGEPLQFEHIHARALLGNTDESKKSINIGSLGNIMFLPKGINESKGIKTIYDLVNYVDYKDLIKESKYPSVSDFDYIDEYLEKCDYDRINSYLETRSLEYANNIIDALFNSHFSR